MEAYQYRIGKLLQKFHVLVVRVRKVLLYTGYETDQRLAQLTHMFVVCATHTSFYNSCYGHKKVNFLKYRFTELACIVGRLDNTYEKPNLECVA